MTGQMIIATLCLGGLCLLMWWLARLARTRLGVGAGTVTSDGLRVVGKRPLDQKHTLWVVEIAKGRHILLGSSVDGSVAKLDDISAAEFAAMTDDAPPARTLTVTPALAASTAAGHADEDVNDSDAPDKPRFATVGESFQHLLGKARDARDARRASGD